MIKILLCIGLLLSLPANARPVYRDLSGLWVMHFKYTGAYKQRSRLMAIRFSPEGNCSSPEKTKCIWFQVGEGVIINYFAEKNGEWEQANRFKTESFFGKRITGSIYDNSTNTKIGTWLMIRSERETNLESLTYNSLWEKWDLHYRLKSQENWTIEPFEMQGDGSCLIRGNLQNCLWSQSADYASFWMPISDTSEAAYFRTSFNPIVFNPSGEIHSAKSDEVIGSWFLTPASN